MTGFFLVVKNFEYLGTKLLAFPDIFPQQGMQCFYYSSSDLFEFLLQKKKVIKPLIAIFLLVISKQCYSIFVTNIFLFFNFQSGLSIRGKVCIKVGRGVAVVEGANFAEE